MHHHFSTYYDLDRKMREQEVKRATQRRYWVEQSQRYKPVTRRHPRWRTFIAMIIGFFF